MSLNLLLKTKRTLFYIGLLIELALLYFNLVFWHQAWLGLILFLLYFLSVGSWWQKIFKKVFGMKGKDFVTRLFSWFSIFLLLSFVSSIFVVWYKVTPAIIWLVYLFTALLSLLVFILVKQSKRKLHETFNVWEPKTKAIKKMLFKKNIFFIFFYLILWLVGLFLLAKNQSDIVLNSPWQVIDKYYLPVFFVLTSLLFVIVFSQHKVKLILSFIILHSLLLHFYLPLSHAMPWGGDVWRHIAIEEKLTQGEFYPPVLFGEEAKWREVFNVDLPEAIVIPNKYVYGQLWGSSVLLSQTFKLNLLTINKWLIPILWSIMLPLIFFRMGRLLFGSWRKGLFLAALASIAFPLQALGALTLPVSLGYLTFFFVFMLWLQYLRDENYLQKRIVFLFSFLMIFGYTMHFILIWFIILVSYIVMWFSKSETNIFKKNWSKYVLGAGLALVSVLLFPLIEIVSGTSALPWRLDYLAQLKQLLGQFSGWFFASSIRPHDILSGNIIFNHTPALAFVPSLFSNWRWHIMFVVILIWLVVFYAIYASKKSKMQVQWTILRYLFAVVAGGYIIGWFVLEGDRSFVRRLDAVFAFLILAFFVYGFYYLIIKNKVRDSLAKVLVIFLCLSFGWLATTSYASGPDMRVVSENEYEAANYVLGNTNFEDNNYCVLADTWTLLILEGLSGQKIVGGGFPITYQFAQPERVSLHQEIKYANNTNILAQMHKLTKSDKCWVILQKDDLGIENEEFMHLIMNDAGKVLGDFVIWAEMASGTPLLTE